MGLKKINAFCFPWDRSTQISLFTGGESKKQDHVKTGMYWEPQRKICSVPGSEVSAKKIKALKGKGRKVNKQSDSGLAVV